MVSSNTGMRMIEHLRELLLTGFAFDREKLPAFRYYLEAYIPGFRDSKDGGK